jgi:DNA-binding MarR family transcriptional regulator
MPNRVKKTGTRANLNLLEMLVLALVQSGVTAPYDLVSHAGLSVGNTGPVLKRLEKAGILKQETGPRRRTDYTLTPKGEGEFRRSLESGRANYWGLGGPSTYDSASRAIYLLWSYYGPNEAAKCVEFAVAELRRQAQGRRREAEEMKESLNQTTLAHVLAARRTLGATLYWFIKSTMDASLFDLQIESLRSISNALPGLPESLRSAQFDTGTTAVE